MGVGAVQDNITLLTNSPHIQLHIQTNKVTYICKFVYAKYYVFCIRLSINWDDTVFVHKNTIYLTIQRSRECSSVTRNVP